MRQIPVSAPPSEKFEVTVSAEGAKLRFVTLSETRGKAVTAAMKAFRSRTELPKSVQLKVEV